MRKGSHKDTKAPRGEFVAAKETKGWLKADFSEG